MRFLFAIVLAIASQPAFAAADLILTGGRVWTGDPTNPEATALAIKGDHVVAVGDDATIAALADTGTRRIALHGRRVVPGINDAHVHLGSRLASIELDLPFPEPTTEEVLSALRAKPTDGNGWITGTIGAHAFADPALRLPRLDKLQPTRPVMLESFTGHGTVINSAARRRLDIDPGQPVAGGWYGRSTDGAFDGRLFEYAQWRARTSDRDPDDDATVQRIHDYALGAIRLGITSIQDMPIESVDHLLALWRRADVPLRLRVMRLPIPATLDASLDGTRIPVHHDGLPRVRVSGTKWVLDGTPVEQGAALRAPYPDSMLAGRMNFSRSEIERILREILARDDQPLLHVSGDAAADALLDAMAAIAPPATWRPKRLRMEHGDGLAPDLLPRVADFGIVVVQNPAHLHVNDPRMQQMIRERQFQPLSDLLARGIPLALGSDGPNNPWLNLLWATTPGNRDDQMLDREQGLRAYTAGSAFAEFAENEKGRLAPGYLADLAVLSQDPLTVPAEALPATRSLLTVIGGTIAWRDPDF